MQHTISIIGSFQKYFSDGVLGVTKLCQEAGLRVLSPKGNSITDSIGAFVIFDNDKKEYNPVEIEAITIKRIMDSDYVFVYDPEGYVGRTTSFEIGWRMGINKPIFYLERPDDLPIPVVEEQIMSLGEFLNFAKTHTPTPINNYRLCPEAEEALSDLRARTSYKEQDYEIEF